MLEIKGKDAYDQSIKSAKIVVIDFSATWCGPCKTLKPVLEELDKEYTEKKADVKFFSMDIDENENKNVIKPFKIEAVPTVVFLVKGEYKKKKLVGCHPKKDYTDKIDTLLKI